MILPALYMRIHVHRAFRPTLIGLKMAVTTPVTTTHLEELPEACFTLSRHATDHLRG
jgi:hypothetical protein